MNKPRVLNPSHIQIKPKMTGGSISMLGQVIAQCQLCLVHLSQYPRIINTPPLTAHSASIPSTLTISIILQPWICQRPIYGPRLIMSHSLATTSMPTTNWINLRAYPTVVTKLYSQCYLVIHISLWGSIVLIVLLYFYVYTYVLCSWRTLVRTDTIVSLMLLFTRRT